MRKGAQPLAVLGTQKADATSVDFSRDSSLVAACCGKSEISIWKVPCYSFFINLLNYSFHKLRDPHDPHDPNNFHNSCNPDNPHNPHKSHKLKKSRFRTSQKGVVGVTTWSRRW